MAEYDKTFHDGSRTPLPPSNVPKDLALGAAGVAVIQKSRSLPARVHVDDPRGVLTRICASPVFDRPPGVDLSCLSYGEAIRMAALFTVLAAAIDRAETADPTSGGQAA